MIEPQQGACILTGAEGENADDCTTHEHEGPPSTVITVDGKLVSSCCSAELSITRSVGPDIAVYAAEELEPAEGNVPETLRVTYQKTYDGEGDAYEVRCTRCAAIIDIEVEES